MGVKAIFGDDVSVLLGRKVPGSMSFRPRNAVRTLPQLEPSSIETNVMFQVCADQRRPMSLRRNAQITLCASRAMEAPLFL